MAGSKKEAESFGIPCESSRGDSQYPLSIGITPSFSSSLKRSLSATEEDGRAAKRKKEDELDMFPSDLALKSLHERLQKINSDPTLYSNPHNMVTFPFPLIGERLPAEQFDFTEDLHFEYMGRNTFSELFQKVEELKIGKGFSRLYIQGTMGYGKSHMLAVLAGLLSRKGKRVVYLPDCRELVQDTMSYMQTALLCAFADPPSSDVRNEIRALMSESEVIAFCRQNRSMYFIMDQMNALDREDSNEDMVDNGRKNAVQKFLHRLTIGQFEITSASANHKTALHMKKKQTNELKLELMGGMSDDEMKQWWIHHDERVPIFGDDDDKARVEDLTGCIPLLLRPLLRFAKKSFGEIEKEFWSHHELVTVQENVAQFYMQKMKGESQLSYEQSYLPALVSCMTASSLTWKTLELFDCRYFYPDKEWCGKCTCGLARQAATIFIRRRSPGLLCGETWLQSLHTFKNNPSVVGFLVEQACLSAVSLTGFHHSLIKWQPFTATIFRGDLLKAIPSTGSSKSDVILYDPTHALVLCSGRGYTEGMKG